MLRILQCRMMEKNMNRVSAMQPIDGVLARLHLQIQNNS